MNEISPELDMEQVTGTRPFQRLWEIGALDPARKLCCPKREAGQLALAKVPVLPRYVLLTARNEPPFPSGMDSYRVPELEAGRPFTWKPWCTGRRQLTLFLDLGRTLPGTVELDAEIPAGITVTIETGEAIQPTRLYNVTPAVDGKRHTFRPEIAHGGWAGMRFVWINFSGLNDTAPIAIHRLQGICQICSSPYIGDFSCSDGEMTRIWEMCAYSAHAVMAQPLNNGTEPKPALQNLCMDRVDRFPWAGDTRVIQTAVLDVFGEYDLVRANLEQFIPRGQRPIADPTGIAPYTLDWALAVIDYFQRSGDTDYLRSRMDDLLAIVEKFDGPPPETWMFFDWDRRIDAPEAIPTQTDAAFIGKYVQACRAVAAAAKSIDCGAVAEHVSETADRHAAKWRAAHPDWAAVYDIHAITNLLLGGVLTEKDFDQAFGKAYLDRRRRFTGTPYFGIYVLNALAKMGRHYEAVEMLHDYWGTMIDAGATTTWEEWDPNMQLPVNAQPPQQGPPRTYGGLSLIQPAGAGPVRWLFAEIVGITPETPGFQRVRIEPHTAGLAWTRGTVATPLGPMTVHWQNRPNQFIISYDVPEACQGVTIVVPESRLYTLDEKKIEPSSGGNGTATLLLAGGKHDLRCDKYGNT